VVSYDKSATTVQTSVPIGRRGAIVVENNGSAGRTVTVDVAGAHEPSSLRGGRSLALRKVPKAVVDTRSGLQLSNLGDGTTKDFSVGDSVPRDSDAVLLSITARGATTAGTLTFWKPGGARPDTVDLSVEPGQIVSGTVVTGLADGRKVRVRNNGAKGLDLRVTVLGSFR
jgi:hypothetical protein